LLDYKDVTMRKILVLLSLLLSANAFADSIRCYDNGHLIYHREVKNVTFTGDFFVFQEIASDKVVLYSGKCVLKIDA
jgi:hypothetical protein